MKEVLCWMMETQYKKVVYMADVLTKEQRHKNMKNTHGKDTKIEINQKIQNVREKGFLKNIFKKKSEK